MPDQSLIRTLLLPELFLVSFKRVPDSRMIEVVARKEAKVEYCPKCASPSTSTYDTRRVRLKDEPFRTFRVWLTVIKRRLWCRPCGKPFTEHDFMHAVPSQQLVQHVPLAMIWESVVVPKVAARKFVAKPNPDLIVTAEAVISGQ